MNTAAVCALLGVTYAQLLALMNNQQFPTPLSSDGYGNFVFDAGQISAFASLMTSVASNGWNVSQTSFPSVNWERLAVTSPGRYAYASGGLFGGRSAGLFD